MLAILIDPDKLGTRNTFEEEALAFVDWVRQSPPAPGSDGVLLAGEPERAARKERERAGIEVDDSTWAELVESGKKVGFAF